MTRSLIELYKAELQIATIDNHIHARLYLPFQCMLVCPLVATREALKNPQVRLQTTALLKSLPYAPQHSKASNLDLQAPSPAPGLPLKDNSPSVWEWGSRHISILPCRQIQSQPTAENLTDVHQLQAKGYSWFSDLLPPPSFPQFWELRRR